MVTAQFSKRLLDPPVTSVVGHTQFTSLGLRLTGTSLAEGELHSRVVGKSQSRSPRTAGDTTTLRPKKRKVCAKPFILLKDTRHEDIRQTTERKTYFGALSIIAM